MSAVSSRSHVSKDENKLDKEMEIWKDPSHIDNNVYNMHAYINAQTQSQTHKAL